MTDIVTPARRSEIMGRIRGKNTAPEMRVRSLLHRAGYRYRLHVASLPGRPDIVLPKYKTVVRVQGCFWHRHAGCALAYEPKSRVDFWNAKFKANCVRDSAQREQLESEGWQVIDVWECETRDIAVLADILASRIPANRPQCPPHLAEHGLADETNQC
jgi:DNA mismatch endonuclease, patch repair protein